MPSFPHLQFQLTLRQVLIRGRSVLPPRPHFDLGGWGYTINILSVVWSMIMILVYVFPLYVPVTIATTENMNWGIAIVGATILFPGIWWVAKARKTYIKEHNSIMEDNVLVADGLSAKRDDEVKIRQ